MLAKMYFSVKDAMNYQIIACEKSPNPIFLFQDGQFSFPLNEAGKKLLEIANNDPNQFLPIDYPLVLKNAVTSGLIENGHTDFHRQHFNWTYVIEVTPDATLAYVYGVDISRQVEAELKERIDSKTKLLKWEYAQKEITNPEKGPYCLLFMDLDDFGSINKQFSHRAGDEVIKEFVRIVKHCLRTGDIFVRYNVGKSDEFVIARRYRQIDREDEATKRMSDTYRKISRAVANSGKIHHIINRPLYACGGIATSNMACQLNVPVDECADRACSIAKKYREERKLQKGVLKIFKSNKKSRIRAYAS